MCIDFDGHHSGGSSFVYVNDFWLLQKLFDTHRYKFSSDKEQINESQYRVTRPNSVQIRHSGRTGNPSVTGTLQVSASGSPV